MSMTGVRLNGTPVLAPIVTSIKGASNSVAKSRIRTISSSSSSTPGSCSGSGLRTPNRDSTYSTISTDSSLSTSTSAGLITPRESNIFSLDFETPTKCRDPLLSHVEQLPEGKPGVEDAHEDRMEHLNLDSARTENWWMLNTRPDAKVIVTNSISTERSPSSVRRSSKSYPQTRLDDSPTLPPTQVHAHSRIEVWSSGSSLKSRPSLHASNLTVVEAGVDIDVPLDDSPTLPCSIDSVEDIPALFLDARRHVERSKSSSSRELEKMIARPRLRSNDSIPSGSRSGKNATAAVEPDISKRSGLTVEGRWKGKGKETEIRADSMNPFDLSNLRSKKSGMNRDTDALVNAKEDKSKDVAGIEHEMLLQHRHRRPFTQRQNRAQPLVTPSSPPTSSHTVSSSSSSSSSITPVIPNRTSSRRTPVLPSRGSSLRSSSAAASSASFVSGSGPSATSSTNTSSSASSSTIAPTSTSALTPALSRINLAYPGLTSRPGHTPIRTFSHPPLSIQNRTSSLKLKKRLSPTFLDSISETPKDLDLPPDGRWALRKPVRKIGHSKSTPSLRSSQSTRAASRPYLNKNPSAAFDPTCALDFDIDMTIKFKLRRSNSTSQSSSPAIDKRDVLSFPSSSSLSTLNAGSDSGERERSGRSSMSDIARSFISIPTTTSGTSTNSNAGVSRSSLPQLTTEDTSPSRRGIYGHNTMNTLRRSPGSQTLLNLNPKNRSASLSSSTPSNTVENSYSTRRPSLLGLPAWSPTSKAGSAKPPTLRSVSDPATAATTINLSHVVPFYALSNLNPRSQSRSRVNLVTAASALGNSHTGRIPTISLDIPRFDADDIFGPAEIGPFGQGTSDTKLNAEAYDDINDSEDVFGCLGVDDMDVDHIHHVMKDDLMAFYEAEKWAWPSPPFRVPPGSGIERTPLKPIVHTYSSTIRDTPTTIATVTPGLSTSGTLDSLILSTPAPTTPYETEYDSESEECWLHGEAEYLDGWQAKEKVRAKLAKRALALKMKAELNAEDMVVEGNKAAAVGAGSDGWGYPLNREPRPNSFGGSSVRSMDIVL